MSLKTFEMVALPSHFKLVPLRRATTGEYIEEWEVKSFKYQELKNIFQVMVNKIAKNKKIFRLMKYSYIIHLWE